MQAVKVASPPHCRLALQGMHLMDLLTWASIELAPRIPSTFPYPVKQCGGSVTRSACLCDGSKLGCQFDCLWKQLKHRLLGTPVRAVRSLKQEDSPRVWVTPGGSPDERTRKVDTALPSLLLTSSSVPCLRWNLLLQDPHGG